MIIPFFRALNHFLKFPPMGHKVLLFIHDGLYNHPYATGEERDLDDLKALELRWVRKTATMDAARKQRLEEILKLLGHASI